MYPGCVGRYVWRSRGCEVLLSGVLASAPVVVAEAVSSSSSFFFLSFSFCSSNVVIVLRSVQIVRG